MRTVADVLREVGDVTHFLGIDVADVNTKGLFDTCPLHVAAVWGDCEAIGLLVAAGARIDQRGEHGHTPLMEAVAQGNDEAVKLLISLGAGPLRNDDGLLPSQYAAIGGKTELAKFLEQHDF